MKFNGLGFHLRTTITNFDFPMQVNHCHTYRRIVMEDEIGANKMSSINASISAILMVTEKM